MVEPDKVYVNYLMAWSAVKAGGTPPSYQDLHVQAAITLGVQDAKRATNSGPRPMKVIAAAIKRLLEADSAEE